MNKTRKASIGATLTWVIATIIILVVVVVFVYLTEIIFVEQTIGKLIYSEERINYFGVDASQSLFAFLKTDFDGKNVQDYIQDKNYISIKENINQLLISLPENDFKKFLGYSLIIDDDEEILGYKDPNSILDKITGQGLEIFSFKSVPIYFPNINIQFKKNVKGAYK